MKPTLEYTDSLPTSFTPQQREQLFKETLKLHELAEKVVESAGADNAKNRQAQMDLVRPVILSVRDSAPILSSLYTEVALNARPITPELQGVLETAFRNIFTAIKDFAEQAQEKLVPPRAESSPGSINGRQSAAQSPLIAGIQQLEKGGIQNILTATAEHTPEDYGKNTVLGVKDIGDLAAGLVFAYQQQGLIGPEIERAMPKFGYRSTTHARSCRTFAVDETLKPYSIPDVLDPRKTTILKN
jgi:hypothetical protein